MKTLITLAFLVLSPAAMAAPGSIVCTAMAYDYEKNISLPEVEQRCDLFADPEFGPSGECAFTAFGKLEVTASFLNKELDEMQATLNGISVRAYSGLTLWDHGASTQYTVVCVTRD